MVIFTVPNLQMKLYHRLCINGQNIVYIGFGTICGSGTPGGSWNMSPEDKGRGYYHPGRGSRLSEVSGQGLDYKPLLFH